MRYDYKGKLIVIEGTDASGKGTQSKRLSERLNSEGLTSSLVSFPTYNTPSGALVGKQILAKELKGYEGWPAEIFGNPAVLDPLATCCYYAANRRFEFVNAMQPLLIKGTNFILDRYVESNMAHQGGKLQKDARMEFWKGLISFEYDFLQLPEPDIRVLLYMPFKVGMVLKKKLGEKLDGVEKDMNYLKNADETYLQLAETFGWTKIDCIRPGMESRIELLDEKMILGMSLEECLSVMNVKDINEVVKSKDEIHEEVYAVVRKILS